MKRKSAYTVILICFVTLLSSANQTSSHGQNETLALSAKNNCCSQPVSEKQPESNFQPLNLFLFDL